jgi:hypothetical protein
MKRHDLLRLFVVQKRKVLLLQAGDRFSRLVGHDHIERDAAMRTIRRDGCRRSELPRRSILLRKHTKERKAE